MNMLLLGSGLFLSAFAGHWLLWRIRVPRHAITVLLLIYGFVLILALILVYLGKVPQSLRPGDCWEYIRVIGFYVAVTFVYVITYSGVEDDSPSFSLVKYVALAGERGRSYEEFALIITDEMTVHSRLRALLQGGLVERTGDRYMLTSKGRFWNRLFALWRGIVRSQEGG